MQKLLLAATLLTALGAIAISSSLNAGHKSTTMTSAMDPTALTLMAKDLPLVQVNEPF